jgi:hypothetical protein
MSSSFITYPYDSEDKILKCTFTPTKESPHIILAAFGCAGTTSNKQKKVAKGIKNLNPKPHAVLNIGDMIYSVGLNTRNVKLALQQFKDFLVEIYGECDAPFFFDLGNHEANFTNKAKGNSKYDLPFQLKGSQTKEEALEKLNTFVKTVELYNLGFSIRALNLQEFKVETLEDISQLLAFLKKHQVMGSSAIAQLESSLNQKNNEFLNKNEFDKTIAILELLKAQLPEHLLSSLKDKQKASFHIPERYYLQRIVNTETNEVILIYHIDTNLLVIDEEQQNWLKNSYHKHAPTATRIIFSQHHGPWWTTGPRAEDPEDTKKYRVKDPGNLHRGIGRVFKRLAIDILPHIFVIAHEHTGSLAGNLWAESEAMQNHLPQLLITTGNGGAEDNQKDFAFLPPGLIQSFTGAGIFILELFSKGAVNASYHSCDAITLKSEEVVQPQKLFSIACDKQGKIIGAPPPVNIHPSFFSPTKEKVKGSNEAIKQWSKNLFTVLATDDLSLLDIFIAGFANYQFDIEDNKKLGESLISFDKLQDLFKQSDISSAVTHSGQVNPYQTKEEQAYEKNKIILRMYIEKVETLLCEYLQDKPGFYTVFSAQLCILHLVLRMIYAYLDAEKNLQKAISRMLERLDISIEEYEARLLTEASLPLSSSSVSATIRSSDPGIGVGTPSHEDSIFDRIIPASYDDDSDDENAVQESDPLLLVHSFEMSFNEISVSPEAVLLPIAIELKSRENLIRAIHVAIHQYLRFTYPEEPVVYQRLSEFPDVAASLLLLEMLPKVSSPLQLIAAFLKECPDSLKIKNFKTLNTANLRRVILNALAHYRADIFTDNSFNTDKIYESVQDDCAISTLSKEEINLRENSRYFDLLKSYFSKLAKSEGCQFYNDLLNFNRVSKIASHSGITEQWLKNSGDDNPVLTKLIVCLTEIKKIIAEEGVQQEQSKTSWLCFWLQPKSSLYDEHKQLIGKLIYDLSQNNMSALKGFFDSLDISKTDKLSGLHHQFLTLLLADSTKSQDLAKALLRHPILQTKNWYTEYIPQVERIDRPSDLERPLLA